MIRLLLPVGSVAFFFVLSWATVRLLRPRDPKRFFLGYALLLLVVGGVFVMEALSVILQVLSFKLTGKRIFAMSPIHHHFELKGWKENTVIVRFWILSIMFAFLGLATLKLR